MRKPRADDVPWWMWPLMPIVLPAVFFVALLLAPVCVVLATVFVLYPDQLEQRHDVEGTAHQRGRLARWRACYRRLGLIGRVRRVARLGLRWYRRRTGRCGGTGRPPRFWGLVGP
ncbi:MAG: hypothetical protein U0800_17265 [Isosphaeraceae bacterium]